MSYFRPSIDTLRAYEPGEQPSPGSSILKLNTNENAYPPSAKALATLRDIEPDNLRRYPHPFAEEFRQSAAAVLGINSDWIVVGNGSDDLLAMLFRSISGVKRPVAFPVPTYSLYRTLAQMQEVPTVEVPFDDTFTLPVNGLAAAAAALTIVASPNSPSGNRISTSDLYDLATRTPGVLVIDEAYVEFASGDALDLINRCKNVIVLRTLSKSHSLAGLRLGFAVAQPSLVAGLVKVKDSYNVDAISARVGAVAIRDQDHTRETTKRICSSRESLAKALEAIQYRVWPSEANFLLVQPPGGNARAVYEGLKANGILVRHFNEPTLIDRLRITVGTDEQNEQLLKALECLNR